MPTANVCLLVVDTLLAIEQRAFSRSILIAPEFATIARSKLCLTSIRSHRRSSFSIMNTVKVN